MASRIFMRATADKFNVMNNFLGSTDKIVVKYLGVTVSVTYMRIVM